MKYYFLLNGKLYWANSEMPETSNLFRANPWFAKTEDKILEEWLSSLQPCEITEGELDEVFKWLYHNKSDENGVIKMPINVTDLVNDENGVITFKQPKQVDEASDKVDINELRHKWHNECWSCGLDANKVFDWFIPYINKRKVDEASEAVKSFCEFMHKNNWRISGIDSFYQPHMPRNFDVKFNDVYEIFKSK